MCNTPWSLIVLVQVVPYRAVLEKFLDDLASLVFTICREIRLLRLSICFITLTWSTCCNRCVERCCACRGVLNVCGTLFKEDLEGREIVAGCSRDYLAC